ncbi:MAG: nuclear transport factor 2 family protein [Gemmatimonadales bacterium]|nr:nuclear transport factor 2 family protein [Gemmatimonadales bacterium]MBP6570231.1 nuclear transport factor 2 family protein [Gemmatimonadales bacterium]
MTIRPSAAALLLFVLPASLPAQLPAPEALVKGLITADRSFSEIGNLRGCGAALTEMFAPDVTIPAGPRGVLQGRDSVLAVYAASPGFATAKCSWTPLRGGIAADGTQGFTYGVMTQANADGTAVPFRYLAYWVKGKAGWQVAVYKRLRSPVPAMSTTMRVAAVPPAYIAPRSDAATQRTIEESLAEAERTFSREAQTMGLGPAFAKHGSADAMNLGSQADSNFTFGAEAIGRKIGDGDTTKTSPVSWGPDRVIAASSGDLGVTIGMIYPKEPAADGSKAKGFPFFTVWRRAGPGQPWRYVAE